MTTINRYCIDNGAMIAQAGIFAYQMNIIPSLNETTCTQRLVLCHSSSISFMYFSESKSHQLL